MGNIPREVKKVIKSINSDNRWKIIEYILDNENYAKYDALENNLSMHKGTLDVNLKQLQLGGCLRCISEKGRRFDEKGSYQVSLFCLKILEGSIMAMDPTSYK